MNDVTLTTSLTTVSVTYPATSVSIELVDVHTVNYGWSGFQQHEGVEVIDDIDGQTV